MSLADPIAAAPEASADPVGVASLASISRIRRGDPDTDEPHPANPAWRTRAWADGYAETYDAESGEVVENSQEEPGGSLTIDVGELAYRIEADGRLRISKRATGEVLCEGRVSDFGDLTLAAPALRFDAQELPIKADWFELFTRGVAQCAAAVKLAGGDGVKLSHHFKVEPGK